MKKQILEFKLITWLELKDNLTFLSYTFKTETDWDLLKSMEQI